MPGSLVTNGHSHTQWHTQKNYHRLVLHSTNFNQPWVYSILFLGPEVFIQYIKSLRLLPVILKHKKETCEKSEGITSKKKKGTSYMFYFLPLVGCSLHWGSVCMLYNYALLQMCKLSSLSERITSKNK